MTSIQQITPKFGMATSLKGGATGQAMQAAQADLAAEVVQNQDSFFGRLKHFGTPSDAGNVVTGFMDRLWRGVKRVFKMTFLRPRGYAELGINFLLPGSSLVIHGKHFAEGFFGVSSLFVPRKIAFPGNPSGSKKDFGPKTLVGEFKKLFSGGASKAEVAAEKAAEKAAE